MNQTLTEEEVRANRESAYDIDSTFLNRWSPRSFKQDLVPDEILYSLFEAARWAPSASNEQPWRFIIARTKEDREKFHQFIMPGNRIWCEQAPVLAVAISKKIGSTGKPNGAHAFDTGTAWGYLALEATRKGLIAHAMGGFEHEKAREALQIPQEYDLHAVIAIGYRGERDQLPKNLQEREIPSGRRPLSETLFEGEFDKPAL